MPHPVRAATHADVPRLVELMAEFYAEAGSPLPGERAAATFSRLLADDRLGRVWLLQYGDVYVGYAVLTLGFSMEYGGLDAFVDDLFVQAAHRHQGLGAAALAQVRQACVELGVRALHLEVGCDNEVAQRLYRTAGFEENGRMLLTLRLAAPLHVGGTETSPAVPIAERK